jgi:hypothetical protein
MQAFPVVIAVAMIASVAHAQQFVENPSRPWRSLESDKQYCASSAVQQTHGGYRASADIANELLSGLANIALDEATRSYFWNCLSELGWEKVAETEIARRYREEQRREGAAEPPQPTRRSFFSRGDVREGCRRELAAVVAERGDPREIGHTGDPDWNGHWSSVTLYYGSGARLSFELSYPEGRCQVEKIE